MKRYLSDISTGQYVARASIPVGIVLLLLFTLLGLKPYPRNPGVVFEVETTYHSGSPGRVETAEMSVEGEMLKMEILPDEGSSEQKDEVIFRGDRREMVVVDHKRKAYMVMDEKAMREIGDQVEAAKEMVKDLKIPEEALKHMTKEQREQLEKMMKDGGAPGAVGEMPERQQDDYRKTRERARKEGYPCVKYEVFRDGEKVRELWVTDWDNVDGGDEVEEAFKALAAFLEEMMEVFDDMMGGELGGGLLGGEDGPLTDFTELDGFPIITRDFEDGDLESESVLRSSRRQRLDPAAFEPPSGYKRMSMGPQ